MGSAAETLEGCLRQVAAELQPDEVRDVERLAEAVLEYSADDLRKLGLGVDELHLEVAAPG